MGQSTPNSPKRTSRKLVVQIENVRPVDDERRSLNIHETRAVVQQVPVGDDVFFVDALYRCTFQSRSAFDQGSTLVTTRCSDVTHRYDMIEITKKRHIISSELKE